MVLRGGVVALGKLANHRATLAKILGTIYHAGTTKVKKNRSFKMRISLEKESSAGMGYVPSPLAPADRPC